jgi:hypothetical protein
MMVAEITSISEAVGSFSTVLPNLLSVSWFCYSFEISATTDGSLWSTLPMRGPCIQEICMKGRNNIRPL